MYRSLVLFLVLALLTVGCCSYAEDWTFNDHVFYFKNLLETYLPEMTQCVDTCSWSNPIETPKGDLYTLSAYNLETNACYDFSFYFARNSSLEKPYAPPLDYLTVFAPIDENILNNPQYIAVLLTIQGILTTMVYGVDIAAANDTCFDLTMKYLLDYDFSDSYSVSDEYGNSFHFFYSVNDSGDVIQMVYDTYDY